MEFAFTEEQQMIGETARDFFSENATSERTRLAMAADGIDRELWQIFCCELGLAGVALPEAHGGAGLGMVEFALLAEAAGAQVAAIPLLNVAASARAIAAGGSEGQQAEWLPGIASGEIIAASSSNPDLVVENDRLTGQVLLVPHGGIADVFVLRRGDRSWIVRADAPGVAVQCHTTMDQTRPLATITLDNTPGDPLPDPAAALAAAHEGGWICLAAEALGGAQACLDRTVAYAAERVQFGRQIGSFQAYKHRLADMMVEIEQARSAVYWAACAVDEGSLDAPLALHAAKSFCADTFFRCAGDMIQLHGGIGFTWEHDAHLYFKRARSIQSMLGGGNWHREQIASMILGEAA
jgi:alkylation response protein AidB-like acyl-CoA dehydrogenase